MSTVDIEMKEMAAASKRRASEMEWLRSYKANGGQTWWNIGERGSRKGDAGAQIAIEMTGRDSYAILEKFPQDGAWYGAGSVSTLAEARKLAESKCDMLYR